MTEQVRSMTGCAWCGGGVSRRIVVASLQGDGTVVPTETWWCAEHVTLAVRGNVARKAAVSTFDFAVFDLDGRQVATWA